MTDQKLYDDRTPWELEPHYSAHVSAMTCEKLFAKSDIAAELAFRDARIEALQGELARQQAVASHAIKNSEALATQLDSLRSATLSTAVVVSQASDTITNLRDALVLAREELTALRVAMFKTYATAANAGNLAALLACIEAERNVYEAHSSLPKIHAALESVE